MCGPATCSIAVGAGQGCFPELEAACLLMVCQNEHRLDLCFNQEATPVHHWPGATLATGLH